MSGVRVSGWASRARLSGAFALAMSMGASALGCGGTPVETPQPPVVTASAASDTSGSAPVVAEKIAYPKSVDDLDAAVPKAATLRAIIPGFGLVAKMPGLPTDTILPVIAQEISQKTGVPETVARSLIEGFDGADFFLMPKTGRGEPPAAAILRFRDPKAVEALLSAAKLTRVDEVRYRAERPGGDSIDVAWLPEARIAIVGSSPDVVNAALSSLTGRAPSFQSSPLYQKGSWDRVALTADLAALVADEPELFDAGSKLSLSLGLAGSEVDYVELGSRVPRLGAVVAPSTHPGLGKLPGHALMATDISLKRRQGKTLRDWVVEASRPDRDDSLVSQADLGMKAIMGYGLDDFDKALGDELAMGFYLPEKAKGPFEQRAKTSGAIFITIGSRDEKTANALIEKVATLSKQQKKNKVTASAGKVTVDYGEGVIRIENRKDVVAVAIGGKTTTSDLMKAFTTGKGLLAEDAQFVEYQKRAAKESHVAQYADLNGLIAMMGPELGEGAAQLKKLSATTLSTDLTANPSDKGLELALRGDGVVGILGASSALAVYGVRRYLSEAKGAEARNGVSAIARGAINGFEREGIAMKNGAPVHKLCDSATPVPIKVAKGAKYQPSSDKGKDFDTGSDTAGWRCLKFAMSEPMYFQYDYRVGHGYKGPARGGPNPGPNGFEASAEGDLDGDGKTSLYTVTGKVGTDGMVHLDPGVFVVDEGE